MAREKFTFQAFKTKYPDDGACLDEIMTMKHGGTEIECPHCKRQSKFHRIAKRRAYACQHCGEHVYPCVGTIFEKSRTPLNKWFYAMYLFSTSRHGVPARELERQLGVTYKCAWRMSHELRKLMATADHNGENGGPLSGHVEIDETYLGGRRRNVKGRPSKGDVTKTAVLGLAERDGRIRTEIIADAKMASLHRAVTPHILPPARISTDEWHGYRFLGPMGFDHQTVAHGKGEHVRGDVYTNSVEGYWSRLKNSIKGTHIHISKKHAWKYVGEFSFRYNMRKRPAAIFDQMISAVALPRLADG